MLVFVGAQQNRIPFEFADAMQRLGEKARYIKIAGTGRNALDFHLAFYLGELVHQYPDAAFRVVSKDRGFDPLIAHLQTRGFDVEHCQALSAQIRGQEENATHVSSEIAYTNPNRQS